MKNQLKKIQWINDQVEAIIEKVGELEQKFADELAQVHPVYKKSALNLIHYLAFRSFKVDKLQGELRDMGLPSLSNIEAHVMKSLLSLKTITNYLSGNPAVARQKGIISIKRSTKLLTRNTKLLFGYKSRKRRTRIMVTLPSTAAENPRFVRRLVKLGMSSARINCAHDNEAVWDQMIENIRHSRKKLKKNCRVMMDLGGPKIRTGAIAPGPEVIHFKPKRNALGELLSPAKVWIAPPDILPPDGSFDAIIPVDEFWFNKIKRGNTISLVDSRGKKRTISVDRKQGRGKWGSCKDTVYMTTGTELTLHKLNQAGKEINKVGSLLPLQQSILLRLGDQLILHKDPTPGEPAQYGENGILVKPAHISCTLPEIFKDVKAGEPIFFDDGKVEGLIQAVSEEEIQIEITYAKEAGNKLKSDKGINFPESNLTISGLTEKDRQDLKFVAHKADVVNFSFVNQKSDVLELLEELEKHNSKIGIILKIETQKGFRNLPEILLTAMRSHPIGVMIARGDLAIETGWKNFASIQEEIMRICEAAHIPDVWATQVLENLAKKGVPSRAEITDAAMAQRAECVMLNKGPFIDKAVKMLDRILRRMQRFQNKKETILPKLEGADSLRLSHKRFDI